MPSDSDSHVVDERAERVSRALELREAGHDDWLDEACAGRPDLREQVRSAVDEAGLLPSLLVAGASSDQRVGSQVGTRYRITRRLGAGAMGVVYEAEDCELQRSVALKVLRPGLMDEDRAARRFEREALAMAATDHPSVIAIHDRGRTDDGEAFIVMELVDGLSLGTIVEDLSEVAEGPQDVDGRVLSDRLGIETKGETSYVRIVTRWVADLAAGLAVSHAAGVVHRDIKPSNVIVRRDGRPVLLDFGIALLDEDSSLTRGGTSVGTPAYMPPESVHGDRRTSVTGDVYGLSALLYCLLTLRPPYSGTPAEVLAGLSTREPVAPSRLHSGLPRDLQAIVEKGMSRRPAARYESARALEQDLRSFLMHRPVVARPIGRVRRVARRLKRSKVALGAAAALVLVVAVAAATEVRAAYLDAQYREWLEITPSFPPNFTILKHENRVYVHEQDRADVEALLDRAAAACVDPLPTYLLRASFRLDHGDPRGAAEDMAVIARHEGTRFARALARAYAAVPEDYAGSKAVDLSEVPEPVTARERYLRAYHYLREFSDAADADAGELLDAEVCAGIPHAEELRFALVLLDAMEPEQAHPEAIRLYTDVRRFEERIGVETATTQHYLGYALLNLNRFAESLRYCRKSVELAPRTHVNRTNAAYAAFVRGEIDEVRVHVGIAADVRPNDEKPAKTLIWTYIREYEFDEALAAVETAAPRFEPRSPGWSVEWRGLVETYRALAIWSEVSKLEGDAADERRDELAATLDLAREHLDAAEAAGIQRPAEDAARIVEALGEGDESAAFEVLVRRYLLDVSRWWRLELVERHLPEDLDARSTRAIGDFITLIRREISSASDSVSSDR